jgi:hypothetical protein
LEAELRLVDTGAAFLVGAGGISLLVMPSFWSFAAAAELMTS